MPKNPFVFGGEVLGADFCGRERELAELARDVESGQNVLLYAYRRYGKTSLLRELLARERKAGRTGFLVDLFELDDQVDFANAYFDAFMKAIDDTPTRLLQMVRNFGFRPTVSLSVSSEGNPVFSLDLAPRERDKALRDVIDLPFEFARKKGITMLVILDEFQQITDMDLESKLRSHIQRHHRNVAYIFSGSKTSVISKMFSDASRPFYQSAKQLPLGGIGFEDWQPFIKGKFKESGKEIDDKLVREIVSLAKGCPFYVQQLCHIIWDAAGKKVRSDALEEAVGMVLARARDSHWHLWDSLTTIQKKVARLIAQDPEFLYSKENLLEHRLSASNIQKSIPSLLAKEVLGREEGKLVFQDPLFRLWILRTS